MIEPNLDKNGRREYKQTQHLNMTVKKRYITDDDSVKSIFLSC